MARIEFHLPRGSDRFRNWSNFVEGERQAAQELYAHGASVTVESSRLRVPVEGETVVLPGLLGDCVVHRVVHYYADEDTGRPLDEPFAYVVLR